MANVAVKLFTAALFLCAMGVCAQTMKSDHWSASETLEKYPHHYTMLAFRQSSGGGELHQNFADIFFILDGHATVVTGGSLVDPKTTAPGEIRGKSVDGGSRQDVK